MNNNDIDAQNIPFYGEADNQQTPKQHSIVIARIKTPFGDLLTSATTQGICLLEFTDTDRIPMQLARLKKSYTATIIAGNSEFFAPLAQQLQSYFNGALKIFDIPLDIKGTEFQMQVWQALQNIPYGETRSYQEQAEFIDNPKAVRAVANANRNNKISIIVPCHRVIGKNGTMTGYGGGIWRKEYLLELEKKYQEH
ncbi:MAG TPA: methylated-DNA--[protein]-cysteine S-methyltransferase [Leucothrix mucor]|nr:methylated-DNA--[protein]-cysteine S-methyltransferase [Leucothrix mucor]